MRKPFGDVAPVPPEEWAAQNECWAGARELVYLIQEGDCGPVKIGIAGNPARRLSTLQGGNPCKLHLRKVYRSPNSALIESVTLMMFSYYRISGEWLSAPLAELDAFILGGAQ